MPFDPTAYGAEVAEILALDSSGQRLMPLAMGRCSSDRALEILKSKRAADLFPHSRAPEAALSGLYLYFSCLDEAHTIAQDIDTAEGSYWHAILHRQEPDPGNSGYWFRQVGSHPIFPQLRAEAAAIGVAFGERWDPFAFIDYCEQARAHPGSDQERRALEVQRAEWQLLFHYCAAAGGSAQKSRPGRA
jgi:hypothetical protein